MTNRLTILTDIMSARTIIKYIENDAKNQANLINRRENNHSGHKRSDHYLIRKLPKIELNY